MRPVYDRDGITLYHGDALSILEELPSQLVNTCVSSPPYWNLRDYNIEGQIGLESTMQEYIDRVVGVYSEVRRVLRDDGTAWVNLGDCYCSHTGFRPQSGLPKNRTLATKSICGSIKIPGLKSKDLAGMPWRVAFALQDDGWYLRSDIIWAKPNPEPNSACDRPTRAHEYMFLLSNAERYYYDIEVVKEPAISGLPNRTPAGWITTKGDHNRKLGRYKEGREINPPVEMRNIRDVWHIACKPFPEAHTATYPPELVIPCIKAGCPPGGLVLDPFIGSGTTAVVAHQLGRKCIGIDLSLEYLEKIAIPRIEKATAQQRLFA